jgi:enoyl-CoA hydratase
MTTNYKNITIETENGIGLLTINRPDKLNALNIETISELSDCLNKLDTDPEVKVLILTGSGEKAFVAGADISEFAHFDLENGKKLSSDGQIKLFDRVENMTKPVIAAVNGFALGGGLELAMSAHIRIASENAKLGLPEVSLGVIPGYGGTQRLPQLVGKGRAAEMIFTAQMITAADAEKWGLVNKVVLQADLLNTCKELAAKILKNSPTAIKHAIVSLNACYADGVNGFQVEINEFGKCFDSGDFREGTTAFLEKRKPDFKGN